jgi:hypothetical protein
LFRDTKYARIGVDDRVAHSGSRSLKVEFAGIDTTRLDGEITQTVVLKPSTAYHLSFYVKTEGLVSPEGPKVTVGIPDSNWEASTPAIQSGSHDWALVSADFTTPASPPAERAPAIASGSAVPPNEREQAMTAILSVVRKPAFSYDDPTSGIVWFDDFSIAVR